MICGLVAQAKPRAKMSDAGVPNPSIIRKPAALIEQSRCPIGQDSRMPNPDLIVGRTAETRLELPKPYVKVVAEPIADQVHRHQDQRNAYG